MTDNKQSTQDDQTDKKPDDQQKTPDELEKLQQKCDPSPRLGTSPSGDDEIEKLRQKCDPSLRLGTSPSGDDEIEKLRQKCDEYLNGWKRAKADYLNLKKETEQKQMEMIQFANAMLLSQLFPIYENFKLACQHIPEAVKKEEWAKGFEHIKKQFTDFFKNLGIEEIKTVGEKFDPSVHEAVEKAPRLGSLGTESLGTRSGSSKDGEAGIVVKEVKAGYKLQGKVLAPAKVVVSE